MKNLINNMETIVNKMEIGLEKFNATGNELKTLSNTYQSLLDHILVIPYSDKIELGYLVQLGAQQQKLDALKDENISSRISMNLNRHELKEADNLATASSKINRISRDISKLLERQFKSYIDLEVYSLLNDSIRLGDSVKVHSELRGKGKSLALYLKCKELNASLIVSSKSQVFSAIELGFNTDVVSGANQYLLHDKRLKNKKFMVDEGVSQDVIDMMISSGHEFLGGFRR